MSLEDLVAELDHKKGGSAARIGAMKKLCEQMTERWCGSDDDWNHFLPDIYEAVKFALKKGVTEEKLAGLTTLKLLLLTFDGPFELRATVDHLMKEDMHVATAAAEVLSLGLWLLHFSSNTSVSSIVDEALQSLSGVGIGSAKCFALLATTKSEEDIVEHVFPLATWLQQKFTHSSEAEKVESAWALCALFSLLRLRQQQQQHQYDPDEVDEFINVEEFSDAIRNVRNLREVATAFDNGKLPEEKLTFNNQPFVFSDVKQIVAIRFLRAILGVALSTQMSFNPRLHEVFDISVESSAVKAKLSNVEKRLGRSPNSDAAKSASKDLKKTRERKDRQRRDDMGYDDE